MDILKIYYPDYRHHQLGHDLLSICMSYVTHTEYKITGSNAHVQHIIRCKDDNHNGIVTTYHADSMIVKSQYTLINGEMHGEYNEWYPNGNIHIKTYYDHDLIKTSYIRYYENGDLCDDVFIDTVNDRIKYHRYYMDNRPCVIYESKDGYGKCVCYHRNGIIMTQYKFITGDFNGVTNDPFVLHVDHTQNILVDMATYDVYINKIDYSLFREQRYGICEGYRNDGKLRLWCVYSEGMLEGKSIIYNTANQRSEYTYLHGKLHGECKLYNQENNELLEVYNYYEGRLHGPVFKFNKYTTTSNYKHGKLHGQFIVTNYDGIIQSQCSYRNGKKEDKEIITCSDGTVNSIEHYKHDKLHGISIRPQIGSVIFSNFYRGVSHGKRIIYNVFNNKLVSEQLYINGSLIETKNDNLYETKKATTTMMMDGEVVSYREDGSIISKYTYSNGIKNGPFAYYSTTGEIFKQGTYLNGELHGWFTYSYVTSQECKCYYVNGILNGPFIEIGSIVSTEGIRYDNYFVGSWKRRLHGNVVSEYNNETRLLVNEKQKFVVESNALFIIDSLYGP